MSYTSLLQLNSLLPRGTICAARAAKILKTPTTKLKAHILGSTTINNDSVTGVCGIFKSKTQDYGYVFEDVCLEMPCKVDKLHRVYEVGDIYETSTIKGKIRYLFYKKKMKGLTYPAAKLCKCVGCVRYAWVRSKGHGKKLYTKVKLS